MLHQKFQKIIWDYYKKNKRELPWRPPSLKLRRDKKTLDPYKIFVSEVMLQQTQALRVIIKYREFIKVFPNFKTLAASPLEKVLTIWKGLGYNRRGLNLKRAAEIIVRDHKGKVPTDPKILVELPGIGPHTAGSILAFAYNLPIPFIETNIRSVFIHFFFNGKQNVHDRDILPLVEKTIDSENSREWYYALMDYGAMLKKTSNPSRQSRHYTKQSPFRGSHRELRSKILSTVLAHPNKNIKHIARNTIIPLKETEQILADLVREGFITKDKNLFRVS